MGEAHLSGPWRRSAADEAGIADGVVRGPEWTTACTAIVRTAVFPRHCGSWWFPAPRRGSWRGGWWEFCGRASFCRSRADRSSTGCGLPMPPPPARAWPLFASERRRNRPVAMRLRHEAARSTRTAGQRLCPGEMRAHFAQRSRSPDLQPLHDRRFGDHCPGVRSCHGSRAHGRRAPWKAHRGPAGDLPPTRPRRRSADCRRPVR